MPGSPKQWEQKGAEQRGPEGRVEAGVAKKGRIIWHRPCPLIACRFVVYEGARPRRESMGECYPFAPKRSTIASTIALAARSAPAMARASEPSGAGASGLSQALAVDSGEKTLL